MPSNKQIFPLGIPEKGYPKKATLVFKDTDASIRSSPGMISVSSSKLGRPVFTFHGVLQASVAMLGAFAFELTEKENGRLYWEDTEKALYLPVPKEKLPECAVVENKAFPEIISRLL